MQLDKLKNIISQAVKASLLAGKEILKIYNTADFGVEMKSDNSPLTLADKASNKVIIELLNDLGIPILSEEEKEVNYSVRKDWDYFWLIDPLDGTKEFIKRNGEFTVNIALIHDQKSIAGVIYVPVLKELYFAINGIGAFKILDFDSIEDFSFDYLVSIANKLPQQCEDRAFSVVGSRSHMSDETQEFIDQIQKRYGKAEVISKGSSLKICMVAEGKADVYPRFAPTMEWDTAAGQAIAVAAGFDVVQKDGKSPVIYNKENLLNPWFIVKPGKMEL